MELEVNASTMRQLAILVQMHGVPVDLPPSKGIPPARYRYERDGNAITLDREVVEPGVVRMSFVCHEWRLIFHYFGSEITLHCVKNPDSFLCDLASLLLNHGKWD
jgi:hypothetical protein